MGKRILFSPIGGTDPISNFRDGSLLHICRIYRPDEVYIFLSKEMYENHIKDNRYAYCLDKLSELINHKIDYKIIVNKDLVNVQEYDVFYKLFMDIISDIKSNMQPEDVLYLNTSSGTPGMKSALFIIATMDEYNMIPLQVSTPLKKINPHLEVSDKEYDIELYWEYNEDNKDDFENRCKEIKSLNLLKLLKKDMIKKHISAYDYNAALVTAQSLVDIENSRLEYMLKAAVYRSKLDSNNADKYANLSNWDNLYDIKDGTYRKIFEYAMILWLKIQREELADYIRALTPIIVSLYELILKKECGIDIEKITYEKQIKKDKVRYWDEAKIKNNYHEIIDIFNKEYKNKFDYDKPVYSHHLVNLINGKSDDYNLKEKINQLTDVEQNIRNIAAHSMVKITDDDIIKRTGLTSKQIFDIIKGLFVKAGINVKSDVWDTYNRMNEMLINEVDEFK